jgi:hypothetical protein
LTASAVTAGRVAAASAALVLAATSRGDAAVLGVAPLLGALRASAVPGIVAALLASSLRWGSTSLEALSGAQAVLGPAGWVGPSSAAAGSWLAAGALLCALVPDGGAPLLGDRRWSDRLGLLDLGLVAAGGAAAAAVVAGPSPGGDLWVRVVAALAGAALALGAAGLRRRHRDVDVGLDVAAGVLGLAAVVAVRAEGGAWSGLVDRSALAEGATIAGAVAIAVVGAWAAVVLRHRTRWSIDAGAA